MCSHKRNDKVWNKCIVWEDVGMYSCDWDKDDIKLGNTVNCNMVLSALWKGEEKPKRIIEKHTIRMVIINI